MENIQHRKHFSTLGLLLFIGTLIIYGVQMGAMKLASFVPAIEENQNLSFLATMLPMYIIAFPIIFLLFKKVPVQVIKEQKKMHVGKILLAFFMCYSATYICNLIGVLTTTVIGMLKQSQVDNVLLNVASGLNLGVIFFVMVICAPIFEELLFRKTLMSRTAQYGEGISILLSGITFALFHGNLNQFVYAFVLGLFFGFIYSKTGNIKYTIILHMLINFMGSVLGLLVLNTTKILEFEEKYMPLFQSGASQEELMALITEYAGGFVIFLCYFIFLMAVVLTGFILLIVNFKKYKLIPGEITLEKGKRFSIVFLNLGMILFSIFWIVQIIVQLFA